MTGLDQHNAYGNSQRTLGTVAGIFVAARDPITEEFGIASVGTLPAVGSLFGDVRVGTGAVLLAGHPMLSWRQQALELMASGKTAKETLDALVTDPNNADAGRAVLIMDDNGRSASFIGHLALSTGQAPRTHAKTRPNIAVLLIDMGQEYPVANTILDSLEATAGKYPLSDRLMMALKEATTLELPPDIRKDAPDRLFWDVPACSSALIVSRESSGYDDRNDRLVDLRVDLTTEPMARLENCYEAWLRAVVGPRLPTIMRRLATDSPAYEIHSQWNLRILQSGK